MMTENIGIGGGQKDALLRRANIKKKFDLPFWKFSKIKSTVWIRIQD